MSNYNNILRDRYYYFARSEATLLNNHRIGSFLYGTIETMETDSSIIAWLRRNRAERMDALDENGIFSVARQRFHRLRYEFAGSYVSGLTIVDVASGLGYGCRILQSKGAKIVMGIEKCPEAVSYAHIQHHLPGIIFVCGDATAIPLPEQSVDALTSFETIEHVPHTGALLTEFRRILKPRGTLIISSPNDWGLTDHHCHTWTPFEFMSEVNLFFQIESVWEQNSDTTSINDEMRDGIVAWNKETGHRAECVLIVAKKR